jgi:hypothetical protein
LQEAFAAIANCFAIGLAAALKTGPTAGLPIFAEWTRIAAQRWPFTRAQGRIKALDGGQSRTKEVPRAIFPPHQRPQKLAAKSSKSGMAGSPGML